MMSDKMKERILRRDWKKLAQRRQQLARLELQYNEATRPASKSSFKGKITRCKIYIETLESCIRRLS